MSIVFSGKILWERGWKEVFIDLFEFGCWLCFNLITESLRSETTVEEVSSPASHWEQSQYWSQTRAQDFGRLDLENL